MRERRPNDWRVDLARRHPLENRVETAIDTHPMLTRLGSSTASMERLDFQLLGPTERLCELALKAKHQPYRGWTSLRPDVAEADLFILDELALRKVLDAGRYAFLLVRDDPGDRWVLWTTMDLVLADKTRADRRLATAGGGVKAKLLLDLTDSPQHHATLPAALSALASSVAVIDRHWTAIGPWPSNRLAPTVGGRT